MMLFSRYLLLPLFGLLLLSLATSSESRKHDRLLKNRQLTNLCPSLLRVLCHRSNYTAAYTSYPEDVVKAISAKFFLNTFGCGPSLAIAPSDHKLLLKMSCGRKWRQNRRIVDHLLCDHVAVWAGADMIQRCTINGTQFWGNDECFDLLKDVWPQEQRNVFCSTLEVDRSNQEYRRARQDMKCLGYYYSTRRTEICANRDNRSL